MNGQVYSSLLFDRLCNTSHSLLINKRLFSFFLFLVLVCEWSQPGAGFDTKDRKWPVFGCGSSWGPPSSPLPSDERRQPKRKKKDVGQVSLKMKEKKEQKRRIPIEKIKEIVVNVTRWQLVAHAVATFSLFLLSFQRMCRLKKKRKERQRERKRPYVCIQDING